MKKILLVACAILVLATLQFGQGLGYDKLIVHHTGGIRWSQCAFGPDGVLWVVYEEDTDRGHPIWVVSYDGTTASAPFNATNSMDIRGERPGITVGSKGHVVVTWGVLAESTVYMRVRDPKTKSWLPIESVKIGYGADEPNAAVDGEGNVHIFWFYESGFKTYSRSKIGGVWGESTKLGDGKDCAGAVAPDGTVWAVWRVKGGNSYKNYYSTRTKTTNWTPSQIVTASGNSTSRPWVAVGPNNVAVAAWSNTDPADQTGSEIRVIKIQPGVEREIVIPKETQHYPRVAVDSSNFIHVVSQRGGGDTGSGMRYTNNKSGTWSEPQAIDSSMNKLVGLSADPFGNVAACQSAFNSNGGSDIWIYSLKPITPVSVITADFTYTPQTGTSPLTVNFVADQQFGSTGQEVAYEWVFGDGATSSGRTISHVYTTAGTFQASLTITDNTGRTDSITKTVIVSLPVLKAGFTFTPQTGYPPLSIAFSANQQLGPDGKEVNYDWVFSDGETASGRNVSRVFNLSGAFQVRLTIIDNIGRTDSIIQTVEVLRTNMVPPLNISSSIQMSRFRNNPEITFNLFWAVNPANIPAHLAGYAIYIKEDNGAYTRLLTVSPSTLSASFKFSDLKKKRAFAVSTLGLGGSESDKVYFQ